MLQRCSHSGRMVGYSYPISVTSGSTVITGASAAMAIWSHKVPTDIEEFTVGWSDSLRVRLKDCIQANEVAQHP